jgi:DNA-binding NtrC family response regulator
MQGVFLRFLETGEIQPVGSTRLESRKDVRVIAATNRNLKELIAEKTFREDLYYRLNVIHLVVPPLRERLEDVPALAAHFSAMLSRKYGTPVPTFTPEAMTRLSSYTWPGNVRELRNVIERIMARLHGSVVELAILPDEVLGISEPRRIAAVAPAAPHPADVLFNTMVKGGESFWTVVYRPFMGRDITRKDLQRIVGHGLEHTRGNYRSLVELFNMPTDDYKRFLNFLRKHECHLPFQQFRGNIVHAGPEPTDFRSAPPLRRASSS